MADVEPETVRRMQALGGADGHFHRQAAEVSAAWLAHAPTCSMVLRNDTPL